MASRSDQLHSHQFTLQRAVGALAMRDPDPVSSPLRRIGGALFASIILAAVAVAAVGVYGQLRPGNGDAWRDGNSMIIEKETGARYVFRDGVLYPVLNYTSALLILQQAQPTAVQVARAQLVGVPRGTPLGIAGAPDPLPGPEQLVTDGWTLCSRPPAAPPGAVATGVESVLRVGGPVPTDPLGTRGVLAADPAGALQLLWNGRRFPLTDPEVVMGAFVWSPASAVTVPTAVLNAIPVGVDLGRIAVPNSSRPSPVDGFRVGQVVVASDQSGNRSFSLVVEGGLADITPVQAGLILADKTNGQTEPADMPQSRYSQPGLAHLSLKPTGDNAPPERTPEQARPAAAGGVCATFAPGAPTRLSVPSTVASTPGEVKVARSAVEPGTLADWVAVPPGRGAVVEALAGPGAPTGALAVISDLGLRFAVPSRAVLANLGYPDVTPLRLPAALVALVPSGRALDPAAAVRPAT